MHNQTKINRIKCLFWFTNFKHFNVLIDIECRMSPTVTLATFIYEYEYEYEYELFY